MYILKTDDELRKELAVKLDEEKVLQEAQNHLVKIEEELMQQWRAIKDPLAKREIHREIFKVRDQILGGEIQRKLSWVRCDIAHIQHQLYSKPSPQYGSIYDSNLNLDYTYISINGIHGVKL